MATKVIHKIGKQTASKYIGFNRYIDIPSPLCVGAKALYNGQSFLVNRYWKNVTCKHCLKHKPEK